MFIKVVDSITFFQFGTGYFPYTESNTQLGKNYKKKVCIWLNYKKLFMFGNNCKNTNNF